MYFTHRCCYEMYVAQSFDLNVRLCPYIHERDVKYGNLYNDICIRNIGAPVDSKNSHCSWPPDKKMLHDAINSTSSFEEVNKSVETIQLVYLLGWDVKKIQPVFQIYESKREAVELLASKISLVVGRVYSLNNRVPDFKEYLEKYSESSLDPIEIFCYWRAIVKYLIEEESQKRQNFMTSIRNSFCLKI